MSIRNLSPRIQRHMGEGVGENPQAQSESFLRLCLTEGLDDDSIIVLTRQHTPTKEVYDYDPDSRVTRRLSKIRNEVGFGVDSSAPSYLEWGEAFERTPTTTTWCVEGLIAQGDNVSLIGAAKVGKSLLALEAAACKATGTPFLGYEQTAGRVLYLDWENRPAMIVARLRNMGFKPSDLGQLAYECFPKMSTLDTREGAEAALKRVTGTGAELVVIDTLQRVLGGEEASSLGIRTMYRNLLMPLREMQVAALRLDHLGKDPSRGARGSSGKNDDVDQAWELAQRKDGLFSLKQTLGRAEHRGGRYVLRRDSDPLQHQVDSSVSDEDEEDEASAPASRTVAQLTAALDDLDVPKTDGRPSAAAALRDAKIPFKTGTLAEAVRKRKALVE